MFKELKEKPKFSNVKEEAFENFFKNLFICFIFGCVGSSFLC